MACWHCTENLPPVYLFLVPPLVGGAPSSTAAQGQIPAGISLHSLSLPTSNLSITLSTSSLSHTPVTFSQSPLSCPPCSDRPLSQLASGSSFSSLPLPPALLLSTPSPLPASLLSEPMSGSSDLLWGLGVRDNDLQNICGLSLNEK